MFLSFVRSSVLPSGLWSSLSLFLRAYLPLSSHLCSSLLASPPHTSLLHYLPIFVSSFTLSFLPVSLRPSIPWTLPTRSPSLPVPSSRFLPPFLASSRPHGTNLMHQFGVRCVSLWCDFDFSFALTLVLTLHLFSET